MLKSLFPAATLTLALALSSQAGVKLLQSYQKLGDKSAPTFNNIYVDKDRVRLEIGTEPNQFFIYRSDKKVFWMVNLKEKSYLEVTEKDILDMSAKADAARKQMEAQMANMPPEQKEMMRKMMDKMAPSSDGPKTIFKKVGAGGTVNGWSTDKYVGMKGDAKRAEIWTAEPKNLGVSTADYQVMRDMSKIFMRFSKDIEGMNGENGLEGLPVKTLTYVDGKAGFQTETKEVKKESFAASLFEVPAGLEKKSMDSMGKPKPK